MAARIPVLWPLKAFGTSAFMVLFFAGYLQLLANPLFPVVVMPLTVFDEWIGFQPAALLPYASLWFYVSLPPALIEARRGTRYSDAEADAALMAGARTRRAARRHADRWAEEGGASWSRFAAAGDGEAPR
jgi:hypothetical protein